MKKERKKEKKGKKSLKNRNSKKGLDSQTDVGLVMELLAKSIFIAVLTIKQMNGFRQYSLTY